MYKSANNSTNIKILIADGSMESANEIANVLRDTGIATPVHQVTDYAELNEKLSPQAGLIICNADHFRIDLDELKNKIDAVDSMASTIILSSDTSREFKKQAFDLGISDILNPSDHELIQLAVKRELSAHQLKLELAESISLQKETQEHYLNLIEENKDAIAFTHDGVHLHANKSYLKLFSFSGMDDLEGLPILDLVSAQHYDTVKSLMRSAVQGSSDTNETTIGCIRHDGSTFDATLRLTASSFDGEPCIRFNVQELAKKQKPHPITHSANRDIDTGLLNRQALFNELNSINIQPSTSPLHQALLYIELNDFENIHLTYGYAASDQLLKQVGQKLIHISDPDETLARYGDCSFVLLTNEKTYQDLNKLGEKICTVFNQSVFQTGLNNLQPSCSIGITTLESTIEDDLPPLDKAYQACKLAANSSGSQFLFYSSQTSQSEAQTDKIVVPTSLIHSALENNRFRLVFQPLMSLRGESGEHFVAMIRLLDNDNREIPASSFLKQVEDAGLMNAIDKWSIENAIGLLSQQIENGQHPRIFLTLSGSSIEDKDLPIWINERLKEQQIKGSHLVFQIHESSARNRLEKTKSLCDDLQQLGCDVVIDRLGLIPEPNKLLVHLNAAYAKFDPFFIEGLTTDKRKQERLQLLNQTLQDLKIKTIATTVEDADSLSTLWNLNVDYIQGYFLQAPSTSMNYDFNMENL